MAFPLSRCTVLFAAATAAGCFVSFVSAQPPRPLADEPTERRSAPADAELEPGYLGLITDDRRDRGQGVRVVKVVEESPAATAGFETGDLIVAVGGQPTGSLEDMAAQLQPHAAGDKVRFEVRRGDATQTIEVALGRRPSRDQRPFEFGRIPERLPEPNGATLPPDNAIQSVPGVRPSAPTSTPLGARGQLLGIRTAQVTDDARQRLRVPQAAGARVVSRVVGSPADQAGVPLDAVIVAVDEQPVASPADLARLIEAAGPGKEVEITFYTGGQQRKLRLTLASTAAPAAAPPNEPGFVPQPLDEQSMPPRAADRVDLLERRVRELEQRIQQLERALDATKPATQVRD